jgi:hypothetical protein
VVAFLIIRKMWKMQETQAISHRTNIQGFGTKSASASDVLISKEAVTALCLALILGDVLTSIDAERVHATARQLNDHGDDRHDF